MKTLPSIAVTMGDPAGIGPEVALRAVAEITESNHPLCQPLLIGSESVWRQVATKLQLPFPDVPLIDPQPLPATVQPGCIDAVYGSASFAYVETAIEAAMAGRVAALVTGPIQKESWHAAGIPFPGHTELLAERTGVAEARMMLTAESISCVLVTVHVGYRDVIAQLTTDNVFESIRLANETVTRLRDHSPRITVCGLNPHAGENGLFGNREEERIIEPAVARARAMGWQITGPLSPDTAFTPARRAQTDVYVCMYHDQGLIPLKALAFDDAVNVTLGLPIVRTSVDHGTAMDIAWQGIASHHSMVEAIRLAITLSNA